MFATSKSPRWCQRFADKFLSALSTVPAGALLVTPKVHLFKGAVSFNSLTPLATFTAAECAFSGYASIALPTLASPLNTAADVRAAMAAVNFLFGSPGTTTESATGYWVDQGATVDWVIAEMFPNPVPFVVLGDFLDLNVVLGVHEKFVVAA